MTAPLADLPGRHARGDRAGITSVCSAHPVVIEAALRLGAEDGTAVLIEATCNQVNQDGGYTGMTPAAFRSFVESIADRVGFSRDALVLGGDHLGPNPWKHLPASEALDRSRAMVEAYARAGFSENPPRHQHGLRRRAACPAGRADRRARRRPRRRRGDGSGDAAGLRDRHRGPDPRRRAGGPRSPAGHCTGCHARDRRCPPPRLRRPQPPGGLRQGDRGGGPARRRVRQRHGGRLPPGGRAGARRPPAAPSRSSSSRPTRPTISRRRRWPRWFGTASRS